MRLSQALHTNRFLFVMNGHKACVDPLKRRFQAISGVDAANFRLHFRRFAKRAEKAIGRHPHSLVIVDGSRIAQNTRTRVQR